MDKVAVFDFCGTITNFQTLDPFLLYAIKKSKNEKKLWIESKIAIRLIKWLDFLLASKGYKKYLYKTILVKMTKDIKENDLYIYGSTYYREIVKPNILVCSTQLIKEFKSKNYKIIIASAGSKYYINEFAKEYDIDGCVTTELKIKDGKSTGKLLFDCMGECKKNAVLKMLGNDSEISVFVSDSYTDIPLYELAIEKIVISYTRHQQWVPKDMKEIIWN